MRLDAWVKATVSAFDRYLIANEGARLDASYSALFAQNLEHMMEEVFDVQFPEFKAKTFFPVDHKTPPASETVAYRQFAKHGVASRGGNYSDDIKLVNVDGRKYTANVIPIKSGYEISIQDLRAAAMANVPLDAMLPAAARHVIEQDIDQIAAFGDSDFGVEGFLNHSVISGSIVSPDTGTWGTASPDEIIADVLKLWNSVAVATKRVHLPTHLLVDSASFGYLQRRVTDTASTIRDYLIASLENCQDVEPWQLLDTASAGNKRIMAYSRNPIVARLDIPQEFEQFDPQPENLAFKVLCHARCAGAKVFYPKAFAYMDGI